MALKKGVFLAKKTTGLTYYRASITFRNKHISLGSFSDEDSAHKSYLFASEILGNPSYKVDDYNESTFLSHSKWVTLINFRDNHYYFKTPIYMHRYYFSYYLDSSTELFFDVEDLFFYANHRIIRRQNYFFVNHYGSQVNILSRYHIKNYGVPGIDYIFKDGNPYNLRYHNVIVISSYHGVKPIIEMNKLHYKARILVKGNYVIGTYENEVTAAIAYNKAADYITQNTSVKKSYPHNFIESIDSQTYHRIYQSIALPETFGLIE